MGKLRSLLHLKRLTAMAWNPFPPISSLPRYFSAIPAMHQSQGEELVKRTSIKSYFVSTSIDLKSMQAEHVCYVIPPTSRALNYIALRYSDFPPEITDMGVEENGYCNRYVVVFQYGSAVLFNFADCEAEQYLDIVRKHASGLLPEMRKDGGIDSMALKRLDADSIRVLGSILGQSIALQHYMKQVLDMFEEVEEINYLMKTGTLNMKREKLFQLVGKINSNLADVIMWLGLCDGSEIALKKANDAHILELYLQEQYKLSAQFSRLDSQLKLVEYNIEDLLNRRPDQMSRGLVIAYTIQIILMTYGAIEGLNEIIVCR